jgi:hypothetical protein
MGFESVPPGMVAGPLGLIGGEMQFIGGEREWNDGDHVNGTMDMVGGGLTATAGTAAWMTAAGVGGLPWLGPVAGAAAAGLGIGRKLDKMFGWSDSISDGLAGYSEDAYAGSITEGRAKIQHEAGRVPETAWGS